MTAPLQGLKVVELARVLAGPWIGQTLAELGATVTKVESPEGDETRGWGPPFIDETAAYFHCANRGKEGLVCDLRDPASLADLKARIAEADVLIENFKVGGLAKYGLEHASLLESNPRLVYCSVTGFGQTGPRAHEPGYDAMIQRLSGVMDLTGDPDGAPQKMGVAFADVFTGLYGVIAIQAALLEREVSGRGQHIDMSLFDTMLGVLANQGQAALLGARATRLGNAHPSIVPYQTFDCADGPLIIACGNTGQFQRLCAVLGTPELADDPAYATNAHRMAHRQALVEALSRSVASWRRSALQDALGAAGVPNGPVNTVAEALADPQTSARGMVIDADGVLGLRTPIRFSRSELSLGKGAPRHPKFGGDD